MIGANTTHAVIATNAPLTQLQAARVAEQAHDGLAMTIRPLHTDFDGDTVVCVSTHAHRPDGDAPDLLRVAAAAVTATARAVLDSVRSATGLHDVPACGDASATA
jgi:L-aminopeptidase/D-esterase-like protein